MIHIGDRYAVKADENQYTLIEKVTRTRETDSKPDYKGEPYKTGDTYQAENYLGYYTTLAQALTRLRRRLQRETVQSADMTIQSAYEAFRRLDKAFSKWARRLDDDECENNECPYHADGPCPASEGCGGFSGTE